MENNKNNKNNKKEKLNRKREKVNRRENRKNKKKEDEKRNEKMQFRPWDSLPSLALSYIFRNLNYKDRLCSIPFVCKAWSSVISDDPRCLSSMIPEYISPDDAFIKKPEYSVQVVRVPGVLRLRNLIKKSSSSSGSGFTTSTITSLFLDPFHFSDGKDPFYLSYRKNNESSDQNEILYLIAHCCPNLKHICFDGFYCASIEAVLEVFYRCKKIELIDFADSPYTDSVQVIVELGKCLPNLRGIRMAGWKNYSIHDVIATHLPRIKLLAFDCECTRDKDFRKLTSESECCLYELQYLSVGLSIIDPPPVCTHIQEIHYEESGYDWSYNFKCVNCKPLRSGPVYRPRIGYRLVCFSCFLIPEKEALRKVSEEIEEAYLEYYLKYYRFDEVYYSIMKQKKEYEYYVSISKEKKNTARRNDPYVVLRRRMRKNKKEASFISKMKMRKKRDKHDYQDYDVNYSFNT